MNHDFAEILARLPQRYPMLMIDRVMEVVPGSSIIALKNVTANEPCLQGHFPGNPIMPGIMLTECLFQAGSLLASYSAEDTSDMCGYTAYVMTADKIKFRKVVTPGDQLHILAKIVFRHSHVWKLAGHILVNNVVVTEAEWTGTVVKEA